MLTAEKMGINLCALFLQINLMLLYSSTSLRLRHTQALFNLSEHVDLFPPVPPPAASEYVVERIKTEAVKACIGSMVRTLLALN